MVILSPRTSDRILLTQFSECPQLAVKILLHVSLVTARRRNDLARPAGAFLQHFVADS
jgi:hypothetical protein